jgi:hypothetical protein
LVTKGGTAVVSSEEVDVVEAKACSKEKKPVGVVDKGPSGLVETERIKVVSMAAIVSASVDIVKQEQHT